MVCKYIITPSYYARGHRDNKRTNERTLARMHAGTNEMKTLTVVDSESHIFLTNSASTLSIRVSFSYLRKKERRDVLNNNLVL